MRTPPTEKPRTEFEGKQNIYFIQIDFLWHIFLYYWVPEKGIWMKSKLLETCWRWCRNTETLHASLGEEQIRESEILNWNWLFFSPTSEERKRKKGAQNFTPTFSLFLFRKKKKFYFKNSVGFPLSVLESQRGGKKFTCP